MVSGSIEEDQCHEMDQSAVKLCWTMKSQLTCTCSNSTIETVEKDVKDVQS